MSWLFFTWKKIIVQWTMFCHFLLFKKEIHFEWAMKMKLQFSEYLIQIVLVDFFCFRDYLSYCCASEQTRQTPVKGDITIRMWKWVGHTLGRPESIARQALTWNPQGKRKKGRPRNTWRRDLEKETAKMGLSWGEMCKLAEDRDAFRSRISGLCS